MEGHLPDEYQQPPFPFITMAEIHAQDGLDLETQPAPQFTQEFPMSSTPGFLDEFQRPAHGLALPPLPIFGPSNYGFAMSSTDPFANQVGPTGHAYITYPAQQPVYFGPRTQSNFQYNQVQQPQHGLILPATQSFYPSFHMLETHTSQDDPAIAPNPSYLYQATDRRSDIIPTKPGMNVNYAHDHTLHERQSPSPIECKPALLRRHSLVTVPYLPSFETDFVSENLHAATQGITKPSCFCNKRDNYAMVACGAPGHNGPKWFHIECVGLARMPPFNESWRCTECKNITDADIAADVEPARSPDTTALTRTPQPRKNRRQQGLVTHQRTSKSQQKVRSTSSRKPLGSNTQSKRKGSAWSAREEDMCIRIMKKVKNSGKCNRIDELWGEVSKQMEHEYGIMRSAAGVKNAWNRNLRAKSRFDERAVPKPQMLRTGLLIGKKKNESKNDDAEEYETTTTSSNSSELSAALGEYGSDEDDIYEF